MSSKDPKTQAAKFLSHLRALENERLALYEELLDTASKALQEEFDWFKIEYAEMSAEVRKLRTQVQKMRLQLETAGLGADSPAALTKHQLKATLLEARKKLHRGYPDEALAILEKRLEREDTIPNMSP